MRERSFEIRHVIGFEETNLTGNVYYVHQNRITLHFDYFRTTADGEQLAARGELQVACMRRDGERTVPVAIPESMRAALEPFTVPRRSS